MTRSGSSFLTRFALAGHHQLAAVAPQLMTMVALLALASAPSFALARQLPVPGIADPRVAVVDYTPDDVVLITVTLGYAVTLDFGSEEKIETASVGDGLNWQITPNRQANLLFVKAMAAPATTNMTVVTSLRVYHFELQAQHRFSAGSRSHRHHGGPLLFAVRFTHPAPAVVTAEPGTANLQPLPPAEKNAAYSYDGARAALPVKVFDDGVSTYFKFADTTEIPAIVAIDRDGKETLVNIANRDGYVVADRVACAFVLRRGTIITRIFNDGYHEDADLTSQLSRHDRHGRPGRLPAAPRPVSTPGSPAASVAPTAQTPSVPHA